MLRRALVPAAFGLMLATVAAGAQNAAANFPDHPIRVIVSVPAGGGVDTVTRIVAAKVSAVLGQPMPVENKSGAAGGVAGIKRLAPQHNKAKKIMATASAAGFPPPSIAMPPAIVPPRIARKVAPSMSALPAGSSSRSR